MYIQHRASSAGSQSPFAGLTRLAVMASAHAEHYISIKSGHMRVEKAAKRDIIAIDRINKHIKSPH